ETIAKAVLKNPGLAKKLYEIHREEKGIRPISKAKENPESLDKHLPAGLSVSHIPENGWNDDTNKKWCKYLGGGWLETWCGELVRGIAKSDEVSVGVNCVRKNGHKFEIDVALVRGHRLYVISCTTDTTLGLCKSKLFEVAMRARQLGGDLARFALVSLLHGAHIDQLKNDVADVWEAPNPPRAFGMDDLKEWAGIQGQPNTSSLMEWLDS
ncbi:MAG TPA: DUF1887 family CARF protein, partial [bacterium]|nr:DUF1887 family CARF protein [bacterium]